MQLGLVGQGISYSLSQALHEYAARQLGHACQYQLFDLRPEELEEFLQKFWQNGGWGLNITQPYKQQVARLCRAPLSSVNTLCRGEAGWVASSSDGEGFVRGVERLGRPFSFYQELLILGAGGAVAAILSYLDRELSQLPGRAQPLKVWVLRRRPEAEAELRRAAGASLQLRFAEFSPAALMQVLPKKQPEVLLVQASSAPQQGDSLEAFCAALTDYQGNFCELLYQKPSQLLKHCRELGLNCQDGLPMLIEQARVAQRLWWGQAASYELLAAYLQDFRAKRAQV